MRIIMINDCAFVGENLFKHFSGEHIKRSRGLFDKTLGISWRILRAHGDVYHVNYLLQDCFIASHLRKFPLIAHAHGTDLRVNIEKFAWRKIVKSNLLSCSKVIVSTPDLLGFAKQFREDAEYLPILVDDEMFYPIKCQAPGDRIKVLIASDSNCEVKGTDVAIQALSLIKDRVDVSIILHGKDIMNILELAARKGLDLNLLPRVPHERMNEYYWGSDVVIDRFALGSMGVVSLEAVKCGKPVLCFVSGDFPEHKDFPLLDLLDPVRIAELILDPGDLHRKELKFIDKYHCVDYVIPKLKRIYEEALN